MAAHSLRPLVQAAVDDETTLAPEDETPKEEVEKEISTLEDEANLPIEEVIRRMKERAEADDDDDEEEEEEGEEDEDEDEATQAKKKQKQ